MPSVQRRLSAKILILDDDEALTDALGQLLEEAGYEVNKRLERTLRSVQEVAPDLVVIDAPPGMEGHVLNFVQRMRIDRQTRAIPVVITTTNLRFIEPGVLRENRIHVMVKPFEIDDFLSAIAKLLHKPGE